MNGFLTRFLSRGRDQQDGALPYRTISWAKSFRRPEEIPLTVRNDPPDSTHRVREKTTRKSAETTLNREVIKEYSLAKYPLEPSSPDITAHTATTENSSFGHARFRPSKDSGTLPPHAPKELSENRNREASRPKSVPLTDVITPEPVVPSQLAKRNSDERLTRLPESNSGAEVTPLTPHNHRIVPKRPAPLKKQQTRPGIIIPDHFPVKSRTVDVHVHIGRIHIQAARENKRTPQVRPRTAPSMTLNDYITARRGVKR